MLAAQNVNTPILNIWVGLWGYLMESMSLNVQNVHTFGFMVNLIQNILKGLKILKIKNNIMQTFKQKFLENRDETGRYIYFSMRTHKQYFVEPFGNGRTDWGSVDPASGEIVNKKGAGKYTGSITEKESMITEENGFSKENIHSLEAGVSVESYIEKLDSQYPTHPDFKGFNG